MLPPVIVTPGTTIIDGGTTLIDQGLVIAPPVAIDQMVDGAIVIFSPAINDFHMSYTLNDSPFTISPGQVQTLPNDRIWTITYLGIETGQVVQYQLSPGRYKFKRQDGVVGLFATRDLPGTEQLPPGGTPNPPPGPQPPALSLTPPVPITPTVGVVPSEGKITIFSRPENQFQMVYALNDNPVTMRPGYVQQFDANQGWNIQFLGSSKGEVSSFPLQAGTYEFVMGEKGVELWNSEGLPARQ